MANIWDALKYKAAQAGAAGLRYISDINPTLGGKAGKLVHQIGTAAGNPLPDVGGTEEAEARGGFQMSLKDPGGAMAKEIKRANELKIPFSEQTQQKIETQKQLAEKSVSSPNETPEGRSPLAHIRSMGHNVGDVVNFNGANWRWNGVNWEPVNSGGGGGGGNNRNFPLGESGVRNIASQIPGMTEEDFAKLDISRWANETASRTEDIARQIEEAAIANAERDYNAIKDALSAQKGEIQTLATQQKEQLAKEKKFTEEGLTEKETSETAQIEKQKKAFEEETEATKEELATNWRDLSLETQRIMRARGISDSAFAASHEGKLLLDFNKGLRQIAKKSQAAFQDFADAVIETNKYYTRERQKLQMDYENNLTNIDNWVRQNIQAIQNQENMALNRKLAEIKNATVQANQLRAQVAQKIADQELALGVWMAQFQMQLKASVATAAQGKVSDAWKNITAVRQNTNLIKTVLENGGQFVRGYWDNGTFVESSKGDSFAVHGPVINYDGTFDYTYLPVTPGYVERESAEFAKKISTTNDLNQLLAQYKGIQNNTNTPTYEQAYGMVYPQKEFVQQPQQPQKTGGFLNSIRNIFGRR